MVGFVPTLGQDGNKYINRKGIIITSEYFAICTLIVKSASPVLQLDYHIHFGVEFGVRHHT